MVSLGEELKCRWCDSQGPTEAGSERLADGSNKGSHDDAKRKSPGIMSPLSPPGSSVRRRSVSANPGFFCAQPWMRFSQAALRRRAL